MNRVARMKQEEAELTDRISNLEAFIEGNVFRELPKIETADLKEQLRCMKAYRAVLRRRIRRAKT